MVNWFTTRFASLTEGLPHDHAIAPYRRPQRRRRLLRVLRGRDPTSRAGRLQPADRLRPRPPGRAAVAIHDPRTAGRRPRTAGRRPRTAGRSPRRAHPATPGGDRLRHGHQHAPDRGPAPRDPRRRGTGSLDHRPLGRRTGRQGQTRPRGARRGLRPPRPHARPGRGLFWGRPTLVGIEPASMTAVFCRNADDRKAEAWRQRLLPFEHLEFVVSDAAKGIAAAVEQVADQRRETDPSAPPLGHGLDLFHTTQEAERVLAQEWRRVEPLWEETEACDAQVEHAKRQGTDARRGPDQTARAAWSKAIAEFERVERLEAAWRRCRAAFEVFHGGGRLNDPAPAAAGIAAGLGGLCGPQRGTGRHFLPRPPRPHFFCRGPQPRAAAA